jgi:phosphosulfolactate synthase
MTVAPRPLGVRAADPTSDRLLADLGIRVSSPTTFVFDPGYDPVTVAAHVDQSAHLMAGLKLSMGGWLLADAEATRRKLTASSEAGVPTISGGTPFELAAARGHERDYIDRCAALGFDCVECAAESPIGDRSPERLVAAAASADIELQAELGGKHSGPFDAREVDRLRALGDTWLAAGAVRLVIEARESGADVGLFADNGELNESFARAFERDFGHAALIYEAPTKRSQFQLLELFGRNVQLGNVRIDELHRVESFRHGMHSDSPHYRSFVDPPGAS